MLSSVAGDRLVSRKHVLHGLNSNGSFPGFYRERSYRVAFDANFTVPYIDGWDGVFSAMHTAETFMSRQNNQSFSAIEQGLSCDTLGPADECFSPWAVNPDVLRPHTNSQMIADQIFPTQMLRLGQNLVCPSMTWYLMD